MNLGREDHCPEHQRRTVGCTECREIAREWQRVRAREIAYYGPRRVPATAVRARVQELMQLGHTPAAIARAAGVSQGGMHKIVHGQHEAVHRNVHDRILAITVKAVEDEEVYVPAIGLSRRMQHLFVMGWSGAMIADRAGTYQKRVYDIASGKTRTILRDDHEALMRVYRDIWSVDGGSNRARATARRNGWVSILAYDDPDNPADSPNTTGEEIAA